MKKYQRKIKWFNPPFSKIVKTNLGKTFFRLIIRHFTKHHKMSKIFNENRIQLSYNSCRNKGSVIAPHNRIITQPTSNNHGCGCRKRAECRLYKKCLTTNIAYKAMVSLPIKPDIKSFTIAETSFKNRFRNNKRDFRHKRYVNSSEFSKYMWKLRGEKITANMKLNTMSIANGTPKGSVCKLCLTEKFWLLKHFNDKHLLNKKPEFNCKCRHKNKLQVKKDVKRLFYLY